MTGTGQAGELLTGAIKPTPVHGMAASASQTNCWVRWGDFTVADVYTRVEEEQLAIRERAGLCDLSPLIKYRIAGRQAPDYLNHLVTRDLARLKPGTVAFSPFCDDRGGVVGFAQVQRLDADAFMMASNMPHLPWLLDATAGFSNVAVDDVTDDFAVLGLHGPASLAALVVCGVDTATTLPAGAFLESKIADRPVRICRTRALGALSFELWVSADHAATVWRRIVSAGRSSGVVPVGQAARNVCRIEAGHLWAGRDFAPARSASHPAAMRTPFDLGLDRLVEFEKGPFNGRAALSGRPRGRGMRRVGLSLEGQAVLQGGRVFKGERICGRVTSVAWSHWLQHLVALAEVDDGFDEQDGPIAVEGLDASDPSAGLRQAGATSEPLPFYRSSASTARASRPVAVPSPERTGDGISGTPR